MKRLIITCTLIASASVVSFGQGVQTANRPATKNVSANTVSNVRKAPSAEMAAERRAKTYQNTLKLTNDQYKAVYEAELSYAKLEADVRASGGQLGEGQAMQMNMSKDESIKKVLTPEQLTKYNATKTKTTSKTN